ncbi:MAG: sugar ABC transporter substrate-binding protein [Caldilineaceae bacterium]
MQKQGLSRRKFLQITGAGLASAAILAACTPAAPGAQKSGAGGATTAKTEIRVAHAWDASFWPRQEEFDKQFNGKHGDLNVIGENTPWGEFRNKYMTQAAAGALPDLLYCQFAWAQQFIQQGSFVNLQPYIDKQTDFNLDDFTKPSLVSYKKNGDLYLVPYDEGPLLLYWNVDMFDAAGIPHPTVDWTMDNLLEAAQKLTKGEGVNKVFGFDGLPGPDGSMNANYLYPWDAKFWNEPEENECHLDTPEAIGALQWWVDFRLKHHVTPTPAEWGSLGGGWNGFVAGKVAMFQQGTWYTPALVKDAKFKWDLWHWPKGPKKQTTSSMGSGYAITKDSKKPDQTWVYLNDYLSKDGQIFMWASTGRGSPARKSAWDAYFESPHAPPSAKVVLEILNSYAVHDVLDTVNGPEITQVAGQTWDLVLLGQMPVDQAVKKITEDLKPVLAKNNPKA